MKKNRNVTHPTRARGILLLAMAFVFAAGCRKGDKGLAKESPVPDTAKAPMQTQDRVPAQDSPSPDSGFTAYFDSIGPALSGDFNGDGTADKAMGVHVRSSGSMEQAPFRKTTLDTTSPYEDLCGGWGLFLIPGGKEASPERIYFCGQQARVQDFSWVGSARMDTLPFPDLKARAGKGVNEVLTLFSQAGITVYLYFDGRGFNIYEPDDEP